MKIKKALIYGFLCWLVVEIISAIFSVFITPGVQFNTIIIPIIIFITTGFFGIFYIRNFDRNELFEGFVGGLIFFLVDLICDLIFIIWPNNVTILFNDYLLHLVCTMIIMPFTLTVLGYLAQMPIQLK